MNGFPRRTAMLSLSPRTVRRARLALVVGSGTLVALAYLFIPAAQAEVGRAVAVLLSGDGAAMSAYLRSYGNWAPIASLILMVLQAVAAPVPAVLVTFANGLAFGVVWGGLLTIAGQTLAAAVCFWIARAFGRAPVEVLAGKLGFSTVDQWVARWGAPGIAVARLIPGLSFDVISFGAGLTGIRGGPFLIATAIGVAPQAFLYTYLIATAPQYALAIVVGTSLVVALLAAVAVVISRRQLAKK